jgi:hypothetical protein
VLDPVALYRRELVHGVSLPVDIVATGRTSVTFRTSDLVTCDMPPRYSVGTRVRWLGTDDAHNNVVLKEGTVVGHHRLVLPVYTYTILTVAGRYDYVMETDLILPSDGRQR